MRAVKLVVLLPLAGRFVFNPLHFSIYGLSISFFGTYRLFLVMLMIVSRHCSRIGTPNHSLGLRYKWPATCSKLKKRLVLLKQWTTCLTSRQPIRHRLSAGCAVGIEGWEVGFSFLISHILAVFKLGNVIMYSNVLVTSVKCTSKYILRMLPGQGTFQYISPNTGNLTNSQNL